MPEQIETYPGGAGSGTGQMKIDWEAYFSSTVAGTETPWAEGKLIMLPGNQAAMYLPDDVNIKTTTPLNRATIDNANYLQMLTAMYPGIARQWAVYGIKPDPDMKAYFDAQHG